MASQAHHGAFGPCSARQRLSTSQPTHPETHPVDPVGLMSFLGAGQMPASTKPHVYIFGGHSGKAKAGPGLKELANVHKEPCCFPVDSWDLGLN